MIENQSSAEIRLDKWLWAARFFKTRALAAEAVTGGKVNINGDRAKPSRIVRLGDELTVRRGSYEWTVVVKDVSRLRGPAPQAQQLYEETDESKRRREAAAAQLRLERPPEFDSPGRPSKKDRRALDRWTRRRW
ncbi:MAG TPA: S4 domain-containing protein [Candidatus Binatia bacterium]|nr:S4 domain-containing protein [Candidatus Binatia bacterium]